MENTAILTKVISMSLIENSNNNKILITVSDGKTKYNSITNPTDFGFGEIVIFIPNGQYFDGIAIEKMQIGLQNISQGLLIKNIFNIENPIEKKNHNKIYFKLGDNVADKLTERFNMDPFQINKWKVYTNWNKFFQDTINLDVKLFSNSDFNIYYSYNSMLIVKGMNNVQSDITTILKSIEYKSLVASGFIKDVLNGEKLFNSLYKK